MLKIHSNGQWTLEKADGDLGQYWKQPVNTKVTAKPGAPINYAEMNKPQPAAEPANTLNYKEINAPKQEEGSSIDYSKLQRPKPSVENVAHVKAKLMEERRAAGKGPEAPRKGIQEIKVRQKTWNQERETAAKQINKR